MKCLLSFPVCSRRLSASLRETHAAWSRVDGDHQQTARSHFRRAHLHRRGNAVMRPAPCSRQRRPCGTRLVEGETQALIWHPEEQRVIGINALGVTPSGATPEFFRDKGMAYPPEYGHIAAVAPGTPGGLMEMLARYGTLSLAEVLAPAIEMAEQAIPSKQAPCAPLRAFAPRSSSGRSRRPYSSRTVRCQRSGSLHSAHRRHSEKLVATEAKASRPAPRAPMRSWRRTIAPVAATWRRNSSAVRRRWRITR